MENNRGQTIFMSVIGVATLLVAIVGATFAYFTIQVSGNNTASSITITTADVAGVTFTDGSAITVANAYPGYSKSKTFTVASAGGNASSSIDYIVELVTSNADLPAASSTANEVYYTVVGSKPNGSTGTVSPSTSTTADLPKTTGRVEIASGTLKGNETHTYTFTVGITERGVAQDGLQGKTYAGVLQVSLAATEGYRTWDESTSNWKIYGS